MILVIAMPCFRLLVAALRKSLRVRISIPTFLLIAALGTIPSRLLADAEFKMSLVVNQDTTWGLAAQRFADAIKYRTQGRIQIKNYFNGQLFAGKQTTEFALLQQGDANFAIGSTINWSPQVKELNLFSLPFMFPSYTALDAVEAGEPGTRLFKVIEQQGVFCALDSDRASHFLVTAKAGGKVDENQVTQLGRALKELGIRMIPAYSHQTTRSAAGV